MTEKKKSSFGKTIFILILLIVLILGGYFGYKYYSEQNRSTYSFNGEFPIEGTWYVSDSGEAYSDNALNFSEYTFGEPDHSGGKILGKLRLVSFDGEEREGEYEIIDKNVLTIYLLNENNYTFTYTYYPEEEKVEMNYAGQDRTLTREKLVVQESIPQTEEEIQIQLWMENIAAADWKNQNDGGILRFDKPLLQEDGVIEGKIHDKVSGNITNYKRISGGEVRFKYNFTDETDYDFSLKIELLDDGKTLVLYMDETQFYRQTH